VTPAAIIMTAHRARGPRGEYLLRTLESLETAWSHYPYPGPMTLYCGIDYGRDQSDIEYFLRTLESLENDAAWLYRGLAVHCHTHRMGPVPNIRATMESACRGAAEVFLRVADDVVLSSDIFALLEWYAGRPDRDDYLGLWPLTYSPDNSRPEVITTSRGDDAVTARQTGERFHMEGMMYSRGAWETHLEPNFTGQVGEHAMTRYMDANPGLRCLSSLANRAIHIGHVGMCDPAWSRRVYGGMELVRPVSGSQDFTYQEADHG